jgi:hypothetical protein
VAHKHIARYADDKPGIERQARRAGLATGRSRHAEAELDERPDHLFGPVE